MVKEVSLLLQTSDLELSPVALFTLHIPVFSHGTSEMRLLLPLLWYTAVCWKGLRELAEISWEWTFGTATLVVCNWVLPAFPPVGCLGSQENKLHSLEFWPLSPWLPSTGLLTIVRLLEKGSLFGWDPFLRQQVTYFGFAVNTGLGR